MILRNACLTVFLLLGVVTCTWSAAAQLEGPPPPVQPPTQPGPFQGVDPLEDVAAKHVSWEPRTLEFGEMDRNETREQTIRITNHSDAPVAIARAFATCGCTVPTVPEAPIEPGQTVDVTVKYEARSVGAHSSTVKLFLTDRRGTVTIPVTASVRAPVLVEPGTFEPVSDADQIVTLKANDGSAFAILGVDPPVIDGFTPQPRTEHQLTLSAARLKQLQHRVSIIKVYIDHPRMDVVVLRSVRLEVSEPTKRLHAWAKGTGELGDLGDIIESGADLMEADVQGLTAVFHASMNGQAERLLALVDFGADVHALGRDDRTALIAAAMSAKSNAQTMQILLDLGIDVNAMDKFGRTALFWAARVTDAERVRMLLEAGANINARGPYEETVLISAAKSKKLEIVKAVVDAGADLFATDRKGHNALHYATLMIGVSRGETKAEQEAIVAYLQEQMAARRG